RAPPAVRPRHLRRPPGRLQPDARRVRDAVARRGRERIPVRQPDRRSVRGRFPGLGDRVGALDLPARRRRRAHRRLLPLPPHRRGCGGVMGAAPSKERAGRPRWVFVLVVILLIFSFNKSAVPSFPLSGFTLNWYREFLSNSDLKGALETSAIVAALSSTGAVALGVLASLALTRRRFRGKSAVSALLLSPLVIPYVVFGVSLLLLFH